MTVYYSSDQLSEGADVHGEMFQAGNTNQTAIGVKDQWEEVGNFSEGLVDNFTYASNALTVGLDGDYELNWACGAKAMSANTVFEFSISINNVIQSKLTIQRKFSTTTDAGAMAGAALLALSSGDIIKFEARNLTDTSNLLVITCDVMTHKI